MMGEYENKLWIMTKTLSLCLTYKSGSTYDLVLIKIMYLLSFDSSVILVKN